MKIKVKIMRGPPGSGKSTYVEKNYPNAIVCSADDFFLRSDGTYQFNPDDLSVAHQLCLRNFITHVSTVLCDDESIVVVDNTNINFVDISTYYRIAEAYGHDIEIVQLTTRFKNIHGVPDNKVQSMDQRMAAAQRNFPMAWKLRLVGG